MKKQWSKPSLVTLDVESTTDFSFNGDRDRYVPDCIENIIGDLGSKR